MEQLLNLVTFDISTSQQLVLKDVPFPKRAGGSKLQTTRAESAPQLFQITRFNLMWFC